MYAFLFKWDPMRAQVDGGVRIGSHFHKNAYRISSDRSPPIEAPMAKEMVWGASIFHRRAPNFDRQQNVPCFFSP